jgi:pyruvate dehydrogenase complex dehydrogenase (E1) component
MEIMSNAQPPAGYHPAILDEIQQRVLWLATRIVDAANHDRDTGDGVKVGGHQASSASLVTVMTALYFAHLDAPDRVSVKPHASPVFHAVQYLLGNLDRAYLPTLRAFGGLQSYPSRTKDPDGVDLSSVFPDRVPVVTVQDAASHALSWLGSALGVPAVSLGVDSFGQSGTVADLYRAHDLDPGSIVNAALAALSLR